MPHPPWHGPTAAKQPTQDRTRAIIDEQPIGIGIDLGWGVIERLDNEAAANTVLDDLTTRIGPSGHQIIAGFGPNYADGSCEPVLFVGIKHDQPAAYLRWDNDIGCKPDVDQRPDTPMLFSDGFDGEITVSADRIRISQPHARLAVLTYVATGKRPTSVEWRPTDESVLGHDGCAVVTLGGGHKPPRLRRLSV